MPTLEEEPRPGRRREAIEDPRRSPMDSVHLSPSLCTRYEGSSRSREGGNDKYFARKYEVCGPFWSRSDRSAIISKRDYGLGKRYNTLDGDSFFAYFC